MSKKIMQTVIVLLTILMVIAFAGSAFAADTDPYNIGQFDNATDSSGASTSISNMIGAIISIARIIGTGVAVIMLIVLAIKYISAAPGDKADIKKHAVVYVVGAIVLFAASGILGIIQNFSKNVSAS